MINNNLNLPTIACSFHSQKLKKYIQSALFSINFLLAIADIERHPDASLVSGIWESFRSHRSHYFVGLFPFRSQLEYAMFKFVGLCEIESIFAYYIFRNLAGRFLCTTDAVKFGRLRAALSRNNKMSLVCIQGARLAFPSFLLRHINFYHEYYINISSCSDTSIGKVKRFMAQL